MKNTGFHVAFICTALLFSGLSKAAEIKVPEDYPTIQSAIDNAIHGDKIKIVYGSYGEYLRLADAKTVDLSCGWDPEYANDRGESTIFGALELNSGTMVVDSLTISKPLTTPTLVLMVATDTDKVQMAWIPGDDGRTRPDDIVYEIHLGEVENFTPSQSTLSGTVTGDSQAEIEGLTADTLFYGKVVAIYDTMTSDPSDPLQVKTHENPVRQDPDATVQNAWDLGLGPHETSDGATYVYNAVGEPPALDAILFSENADGEITVRKVDWVDQSGGVTTVGTSAASLSQALDTGEIYSCFRLSDIHDKDGDLRSSDSDGSSGGISKKSSVLPDGSLYHRIDWKDRLLSAEQTDYAYEVGGVFVTPADQGSIVEFKDSRETSGSFSADAKVRFHPKMITHAKWGGYIYKTLEYAKVSAIGVLSMDATADFNFKAKGSEEKNRTLFEKDWSSYYLVPVSNVWVYQENKLTVNLEATATAEAEIKAHAFAHLAETIEIGVVYDGESWKPILQNDETQNFNASLDIVGKVEAEIRIIPKLETTFYKVATATVSVEPFVGASLKAEKITDNTDFLMAHSGRIIHPTAFDSTLGLEAKVGANLAALGYEWDIFPVTCLLGTGDCAYQFDTLELFSIPALELTSSSSTEFELKATDGTFNAFDRNSIQWEVYPDDATIQPGSCRQVGPVHRCGATLVPGAESEYAIFASGSGLLGEVGRQFKEVNVELKFVLPDTGIHVFYDDTGFLIQAPGPGDDYYGQDAHYSGPQPSYNDNGDGTVADLTTGLVWQKADDGVPRTWQQATDYCASLSLGENENWRLPNPRELFSIVDFSRFDPAIDPVFSGNSDNYWSSSVCAGDPDGVYTVLFLEGLMSLSKKGEGQFARCVRGATPASNLVSNGDGTATDKTTELVWQQSVADELNWEQALNHCETLTLANRSDWRLPNIRELESLTDWDLWHPALPPDFGCCEEYQLVWSSTTYCGSTDYLGPNFAHMLYPHQGVTGVGAKFSPAHVICVRGGPEP